MGRDLGPDLFKFQFESESDMLTVLAKGPYHYKKWMILLQQWEPIISPHLPFKHLLLDKDTRHTTPLLGR